MIPAGTLRHRLVFYSIVKSQSETGAISSNKQLIYSCKAAKQKNIQSINIEAKELFRTDNVTFKIRHTKSLIETMIVKYNSNDYKIVGIDFNVYDNSDIIILEKINK